MPFPVDDNTKETILHHFRQRELIWAEDFFCTIIASSGDKHDILWAIIALRDCGTKQSLPVLKEKLTSSVQDIRAASLLTIAHIAGGDEMDLYIDLLLGASFREKGYALWAMRDCEDPRTITPTIDFLTQNAAKLAKGTFPKQTLQEIVLILAPHFEQNKNVQDIFAQIKKHWLLVDQIERVKIAKSVPYFSAV